jgi:hypothetical protein
MLMKLIVVTVVVRARCLERRQAIFQIIHHSLKEKSNAQVAWEIRQMESTQAKDTPPKKLHIARWPSLTYTHGMRTHTLSAHWQAS